VVRSADYLAKTIKSMKVMLADGSLQTVSANENKDLFNLVVGGYGLFGAIVDNTGRKYNLLPRRRPQAVPGVAHLMVVHFRQIIRRVEAEILDVEPADRAEQGIGGDHAVA
jgi:FAD/FMN-containing dehydrogenase